MKTVTPPASDNPSRRRFMQIMAGLAASPLLPNAEVGGASAVNAARGASIKALDSWLLDLTHYEVMARLNVAAIHAAQKNPDLLTTSNGFILKNIKAVVSGQYDTRYESEFLELSKQLLANPPDSEAITQYFTNARNFRLPNFVTSTQAAVDHVTRALQGGPAGMAQLLYDSEAIHYREAMPKIRALAETNPAVRKILQEAEAGKDFPAMGTKYRADEAVLPADYYTKPAAVTWEARMAEMPAKDKTVKR